MALKSAISSMASMVGRLLAFLSFCGSTLWNCWDRRDILFFGGLGMLWYGLNIISPAVAYSVCGGILLSVGLVGYLFGGDKGL